MFVLGFASMFIPSRSPVCPCCCPPAVCVLLSLIIWSSCSSIVLCESPVFHPIWKWAPSFSDVGSCWIDCRAAGVDCINLCWNVSLVGLLTAAFLLDGVNQTDPESSSGLHLLKLYLMLTRLWLQLQTEQNPQLSLKYHEHSAGEWDADTHSAPHAIQKLDGICFISSQHSAKGLFKKKKILESSQCSVSNRHRSMIKLFCYTIFILSHLKCRNVACLLSKGEAVAAFLTE